MGMSRSAGGTRPRAEFTGPLLNRRGQARAALSGCGELATYTVAKRQLRPPAPVCACHSTSVIVMVIGAPTAPCGRIVRRRRIVSRGGWIVAVVAVGIVIRVIVVRVRQHRAKSEGAEPEPDSGTRADPTAACIRGVRHRR